MNTSCFFSYNDINIAYKIYGEGKPLVILHGWGVSGSVMVPLARQLSSVRKCYVLDLPGFGKSQIPPCPWSIDDYASMLSAFIEQKIFTPADILAHSFGGRITLKLCASEKGHQLIDKVLITGGAGMKPRRSIKFYLKKYTAKALKGPFLLLPASMKKPALNWLRTTRLWKSLGSSDYRKLSGIMRETFVKSVSEYLEGCLPGINHEVLLLWGERDTATPLYQAERMAKGLRNAELVVITEAGHYAFADRPKKFAAIARAFYEG